MLAGDACRLEGRLGRLADRLDRLGHLGHAGVAVGRVLGQRLGHDRHVLGRQLAQVGRRRQVLHQDLAGALAVERHPAGQHLVEDDAGGVDVDLLVVVAGRNLRGHVMDRADALRLRGPLAAADELAQAVVADLDDAVLQEDVARLEVAVDDAVVVQVADGLGQGQEPLLGQFRRASRRDGGSARR